MKQAITFILISIIFISGCTSKTDSYNTKNDYEKNIQLEDFFEDTEKTFVPPKAKPIYNPKPTLDTNTNCHPSYSGCLKANASDYDCAGGSGNGPYYTGTVRVIGPDVFDLDRDNDGIGCE